jgi:glutaredoxin
VLGLSVDSKDSLKAWSESLGGISYPLLSDFYPHGQVAKMFGVLRSEGYSERAIFIIDKSCIIRYVDVHDIDQQPDNEELFRVLGTLAPPGVIAPQPVPAPVEAPAQSRGNVDVIMYCTPWCPACRRAREYFKQNEILYEEIDITRDRAAAQRVRGWANGNEITPTFDVKGTILVDFDKVRLARALGIE